MLLREFLNRTGEGKSAVVGWGRGMGHQGHMFLASSVITQAKDTGGDPYFVVSRTVGKDDPITPEEKLHIYKKVFPKHGHIFHTATDEMPDLTRVLTKLSDHGYTDVTVVVGADQKEGLSYVTQYNGKPNKAGEIPFSFNSLNVISRQETNDPSKDQEGPRATPMRDILKDPNATDDQKFQAWRDSMSPELSDDEVRDLMNKAHTRMGDPMFGKKPKVAKKEKVAETARMSAAVKLQRAWDRERAKSDASRERMRRELELIAGRTKPQEEPKTDQKQDEGLSDLLSKSKTSVKKKIASSEEIRKYFEKEKSNEPPVHKEPGDEKNIKAVHTRSAYEGSVKYANRIIREMRAKEFIAEEIANAGTGHTSELNSDHDNTMKGVTRSRDVGGYDRVYHLNRMMMAMAMHDGKSPHPVDSAKDTWFEKYNTMHPMTQEEDNMIRGAMKTVPTDGKHISKFAKSKEAEGGNKISPVAKKARNKYGI